MAKRKYTPVERARKGGFARGQKLSARKLSDIGKRAAIIRWARVKGLLPDAPFPQTTPDPAS